VKHLLFVAAAIGISIAPAYGQTGTSRANNDVAAQAAAAEAGQAQTNADQQAQYQSDMVAYQQSLRAHHHVVRRDQRRYDRQQRAYADAMAAWRRQVYACHHGHTRACNAPTPNPVDFY
jgi:uncharacterized protein HemX